MTYEAIRSAVRAVPFTPFTLAMAGGTRHRVTHPELIFVPPQPSRILALMTGRSALVAIDALLIESLDFDTSEHPSPNGDHDGNGTT